LGYLFNSIIDAYNPARADHGLKMTRRFGGSRNAAAAKRDYLSLGVFQIKLKPSAALKPSAMSPSKHTILQRALND
jgi:hypothetical protein